jgi:hypothetical protein
MGFIKDLRRGRHAQKDANLLAEEKLYEFVGKEIESGYIREGLWVKATSTASSSEHEDIKREYIRLRVEHLPAESRLFNQIVNEDSIVTEPNITDTKDTSKVDKIEQGGGEIDTSGSDFKGDDSMMITAIQLLVILVVFVTFLMVVALD